MSLITLIASAPFSALTANRPVSPYNIIYAAFLRLLMWAYIYVMFHFFGSLEGSTSTSTDSVDPTKETVYENEMDGKRKEKSEKTEQGKKINDRDVEKGDIAAEECSSSSSKSSS